MSRDPSTWGQGPAASRPGDAGVQGQTKPPRTPRVVAIHVPDLSLQRIRRTALAADGDESRRRPLAVLDEGRVVCCDGEAAEAGVRPGMTAAQALGAMGRLELVTRDAAADRAALRAVAEA